MAYGTHWEWRGFGSLSPRFAKTFLLLPKYYDTHPVTDNYLWIPGLEVNAKFRKGVESGLKFKRLDKRNGDFEVWTEKEDELYEFPLEPEAWQSLTVMLEEVGIQLPEYPREAPDRDTISTLLEEAGCKLLTVSKVRETRILEQSSGSVLVEWSVIKEPQVCTSVGLETWSENEDVDLADEKALKLIKSALPALNIGDEPLDAMNYLDAIKKWAAGEKI